MSWFVFSLICLFSWGTADLFYKKGTDENDRYSHLKIAVFVGLVMGITAFILLPFSESGILKNGFSGLFNNIVRYLPASLSYIISMVIGYAGLRYLELSIVSPVQNASGAFSVLAMLIFFTATGRYTDIRGMFSTLDILGLIFIVGGVIMLAVVEKKLADTERAAVIDHEASKKYRYGVLALLFPLAYCLFDTIGTAADGIILTEEAGLGEIDVLILYGLTFFVAGICAYIFLFIKEKKAYRFFELKTEWPKAAAGLAEEFGQVFYVYAMGAKPVLAAPMVASYCIVSVIFSRLFIKEKLRTSQYACVAAVVIGIVLLGISEGLAEV